MQRILTEARTAAYAAHLRREERSESTVAKYLRAVRALAAFAEGRPMTKELVAAHKARLVEAGRGASTVNGAVAAINGLLSFLGWEDCRVKAVRVQRSAFCSARRELSREEYRRLLDAARGRERLQLAMQTLCASGIRVSELRHFTVEAVRRGEVTIRCKGKTRTVLLPGRLRERLLAYARRQGIAAGVVFRTRGGKPLDRSYIWAQMKALCGLACVCRDKVFPHNLRRLFARSFYRVEKDLARLADVLGHSRLETTRIYIMTTGAEHRRQLERLHLLL